MGLGIWADIYQMILGICESVNVDHSGLPPYTGDVPPSQAWINAGRALVDAAQVYYYDPATWTPWTKATKRTAAGLLGVQWYEIPPGYPGGPTYAQNLVGPVREEHALEFAAISRCCEWVKVTPAGYNWGVGFGPGAQKIPAFANYTALWGTSRTGMWNTMIGRAPGGAPGGVTVVPCGLDAYAYWNAGAGKYNGRVLAYRIRGQLTRARAPKVGTVDTYSAVAGGLKMYDKNIGGAGHGQDFSPCVYASAVAPGQVWDFGAYKGYLASTAGVVAGGTMAYTGDLSLFPGSNSPTYFYLEEDPSYIGERISWVAPIPPAATDWDEYFRWDAADPGAFYVQIDRNA